MLCLQLLGGASVVGDAGPLSGPVVQRRRLALLAQLAAAPSRSVSRDKLIAYFWPDEERERARHFLADSVFTLRKGLGKDSILTVGDDLVLNREAIECDVVQFHEALEVRELERAVSLYRGPFLDGFFVADAPEFERWADAERDRLGRLHAEALEGLATEMERREDNDAAVRWWRRLAAHDPYNSRVALRLMQALSESGDRAGALQHARVHAVLLREEIQVDPDPEVEALAAQLSRLPAPDPAASRPQRPLLGQPAEVVGLGVAGAAGDPPAPPAPAAALPHPTRRWRYRFAMAPLVLVALLVVSARAWSRWYDDGRSLALAGAGPPRPAVVAVLPFSAGGDPETAQLGEDLVVLLSTNLDGAGDIRTVDPYVLISRAAARAGSDPLSPDDASRLTRELGAGMFILGSVFESDGRLRITASLYESSTGAAEAKFSVEGPDVFALVDELSRQLLAGRLHAPGDRLSQLAARTTPSVPALKAYLEGEREFRAARYGPATAAFRRAVREDPQFALAYYRLSTSAEWSFKFVEARQAAEKALHLRGRLSLREQQLISAWHSFVNGEAGEAERLYNSILIEDPFDVEAWSGLGEVLVHYNPVLGRPLGQAFPAFDKVLQLAPHYGEARFHLLEAAAEHGRVATFDSLMQGVDPQSQQLLSWQAARAFAWGTPREMASIQRRLHGAKDVAVGIAAVRTAAHFRDLSGAETLARLLTRPDRPTGWRAAGHIMLAHGHLARGGWDAAASELESARALEPSWALELRALGALLPLATTDAQELRRIRSELEAWDPGRSAPETSFFFATHADAHVQLRLYLLGLISMRLGEDEAVDRFSDQLRAAGRTRRGRELGYSLLSSIEAHRAFRRGDADGALRLLEEDPLQAPLERIALSPFFARALDRYLRAEALQALGQPDEALRWYASLSEGPDLLFWAAAHQRQADLHARAGRMEDANRHSERLRALSYAPQPDR